MKESHPVSEEVHPILESDKPTSEMEKQQPDEPAHIEVLPISSEENKNGEDHIEK